jgi:hypothetical protein
MNILIVNPRDKDVDTGLQVYAHNAIKFFLRELGINRLRGVVKVRIHNKLYIDNHCTEGQCEAIDNRHFIIDVALFGNWISTLAHELVHVKQFAKNELDGGLTRWKTNKYCENIDYWDQHWEKEARRYQIKLMHKFEKHMMG